MSRTCTTATVAKGDGGEGRRRRRATAATGGGPANTEAAGAVLIYPVPPKGVHALLILNNCG